MKYLKKHRKRLIIWLMVFTLVFLCGCDIVSFTKNRVVEPMSDKPDIIINEIGQDIFKTVQEGDQNEFIKLFSNEAKKKDKNLENKVATFFSESGKRISYSDMKSEWYSKNATVQSNKEPEDAWYNENNLYYLGRYIAYGTGINEVIINDMTYAIYFTYVYHYSNEKDDGVDNPDWLGILTCGIYKTEERIVTYENDWGEIEQVLDLTFEPGFHFYLAEEVSK